MVSQGSLGINGAHKRLQAIIRNAERRYQKYGRPDPYNKAKQPYDGMWRELQTLSLKRWRDLCVSLSPFTSIRRVWFIFRSLKFPVSQVKPFRTLLIGRGDPKIITADKFCKMLANLSAATSCIEYHVSFLVTERELDSEQLVNNNCRDSCFSLR